MLAVLGRPTVDDVGTLLEAIETELCFPAHSAIVDVRRLDLCLADPALPSLVFPVERFFRERAADVAKSLVRGVLVHHGGLIAAAVVGYSAALKNQTTCQSIEQAIHWLGFPAEIAIDIERMIESTREGPDAVDLTRILDWLARHLTTASLPACAQGLGVSDRALQRTLSKRETTWRDVVVQARLRRAQDLLTTTDDKLAAIAFDVGLAKPQSLVALFQRELGMTPNQWRKQQRASGLDGGETVE